MKDKRFKTLIAAIMVIVLMLPSLVISAKENDKITSYSMNVIFDEEGKTFDVEETVRLTNTYGEELRDLVFHLYADSYGSYETMPSFSYIDEEKKLTKEQIGDIDITKVLVNGKEVTFSEDKQILKFSLETPLKANDSIDVSISFTLKIPASFSRFGYNEGTYYISNWYPILSIYNTKTDTWDENPFHPIGESNYSEVSNYDVTLTTHKDVITAATGVTESEKIKDESKVINIKAENVRDFVLMMSRKYKCISKEIDGIRVNSYYISSDNPNEDTINQAQRLLDVVSDAVNFFNEAFGKYPYPELDIVETYVEGVAMEYPTLIQMGKYSGKPQQDYSRGAVPWIETAAVHETGHQWWYVSVGSNEFKEPFLDESFTVYSTAMYYEKRNGEYSDKGVLMEIRNNMYFMTPKVPYNSSVDSFNNFGEYVRAIYRSAPILLEDLRDKVGEEKFIKIMQTYFKRYLFKNATIEGFLDVIGEVAGTSVKNYIKKSVTSTDYNAEHLAPTQEQMKIIQREQIKNNLKQREKRTGLSIGSFTLKIIEGDNILIVKPSTLTQQESEIIDNYINEMKMRFKNEYDVNIAVKEDKNITEEDKKNNNIFLMGNPVNNNVIRDMAYYFPMSLTSNGIMTDKLVLRENKNSGIFVMKNPQNSGKRVLVMFWQSMRPTIYNIEWDNMTQFILNTESGMDIRGNF